MEFQFGEVNIVCTDLKRSLEFYCDTLGFVEASREDQAVHLKCGSQPVLLLPFAKNAAASGPYCETATVAFDLYVKDIDAALDYLQSRSVKFAKEQDKPGDYFCIRDPDGNVIEIVPKD